MAYIEEANVELIIESISMRVLERRQDAWRYALKIMNDEERKRVAC